MSTICCLPSYPSQRYPARHCSRLFLPKTATSVQKRVCHCWKCLNMWMASWPRQTLMLSRCLRPGPHFCACRRSCGALSHRCCCFPMRWWGFYESSLPSLRRLGECQRPLFRSFGRGPGAPAPSSCLLCCLSLRW